MDKRKACRVALSASVLVGAAVGVAWANRRLFIVNDVTTGESAAYPSLKSRVYYAEGPAALGAAEQAVRSLKGWRVVHIDDDGYTIEAEVETIGGSLDDVTVFVQPLDLGQSRVAIRSRSRQGRGDLGSNACHIRLLQEAMDQRLIQGAAI